MTLQLQLRALTDEEQSKIARLIRAQSAPVRVEGSDSLSRRQDVVAITPFAQAQKFTLLAEVGVAGYKHREFCMGQYAKLR